MYDSYRIQICTFYQRGACAYGARCRYDHVKPQPPASVSCSSAPPVSLPTTSPSKAPWIPHLDAHAHAHAHDDDDDDEQVFPEPEPTTHDTADLALCSYAAAGSCPRGDKCPHLHGDLCPTCGKHCLHPFRLKDREDHTITCLKMNKHLEALKRSQDIECSVCLERVLFKPRAADRKFGLLSECDHPFCISCIRVWRSSSPSSGMDVNSTLRACPICRKLSYFIIPSVIWYFSQHDKDEIVNSYKGKLK